MDFFAIIFITCLGLIVSILIKLHLNKRRRAEMQALATELGFRFDPLKSRSLADGLSFLKHLNKGGNRYAHNILSGLSPGGEPALIFDYHYEVSSGKTTQEFDLTILTLTLPRAFPELQIEPQGLGSMLKEAFGFGDIDFESIEFSNRYDVRSRDKKFAYDFCNARMIEYLLQNRNFTIEVDRHSLALTFHERLPPILCRANYVRLLEIRNLMPNYLFQS